MKLFQFIGLLSLANITFAEEYEFQTKVQKVMNIIVNSLYKTKEIFLRELISNASDALDKAKVKELKREIEPKELFIRIKADKNVNTLTLIDTGVGMSFEELRDNLGTIAKSGTEEFIQKLEQDNSLIGQFGVGFYSAFLVADKVTVSSRQTDKQFIWSSNGENFSIEEDIRNHLERGTEITLYLKEDSLEFLKDETLVQVIEKHSSFIRHPIYLWKKNVKEKEVEAEQVEEEEISEGEEEKEKTEKKEKKVEYEEVEEWTIMNKQKPIWMRDSKKIPREDYIEFYKSFGKESEEPLTWLHFTADADVQFKGLLYVPKKAPSMFSQQQRQQNKIKLFVKRVLIDEFDDFLPKYLSFVVGLVDSDDLQLNVSRESLQQTKALRQIKKKLTSKAIEMFGIIAKDVSEYESLFKSYGVHLKFGVIEDYKHKKKLMKLLRFASSSDKFISLDDYVGRMRKNQKQIYYITGSSLGEVKNSPFVETLLGRGYEVIFMVDPIDEYLMNSLTEFRDFKFQNVAKDGLEFGDEDEKDKETIENLQKEYQSLADHLLSVLEKDVEKVIVSTRLTSSPCALIATKHGLSGQMLKLANSQAMQDGMEAEVRKMMYGMQKRILEINPYHPLIIKMKDMVVGENTSQLAEGIQVLYQTTMLRSGYSVEDLKKFSGMVENVLRRALGVNEEEEAKVEIKPAPEIDFENKNKSEEKDDENEDEDDKSLKEEKSEEVVRDEL